MLSARRLINDSGSESILFAHKATNLIKDNKLKDALQLCEEGVKRFPFYSEGHNALARCYQLNKQYDEAVKEFERVLFYSPGHIKALKALSFLYYQKKLRQKANSLLMTNALYDPLNSELVGLLKSEKIYEMMYKELPGAQKDAETSFTAEEEVSAIIGEEEEVEEDILGESSDFSEAFIGAEPDEESTIEDKAFEPEFEEDESGMEPEINIAGENSPPADDENSTDLFPEDEESDTLDDISGPKISEENDKEGAGKTEKFADDEQEPDADARIDAAVDEEIIPADPDSGEIIDVNKFSSPEYISTEDDSQSDFERDNIVDHLSESDKDEEKIDLSKFDNRKDDFSTLMDGLFEEEDKQSDEATPGAERDAGSKARAETDRDDIEETAEERPILDTNLIFMDKKQEDEESDVDEPEITAKDESGEEAIADFNTLERDLKQITDVYEPEESVEETEKSGESGEEKDHLNEVIRKIDKKVEERKSDLDEKVPVDEMKTAQALEEDEVSINDILENPNLLTTTFGEILIAQKKFGDALRVFKELAKRDPENVRLKKKIEFLDKMVAIYK